MRKTFILHALRKECVKNQKESVNNEKIRKEFKQLVKNVKIIKVVMYISINYPFKNGRRLTSKEIHNTV